MRIKLIKLKDGSGDSHAINFPIYEGLSLEKFPCEMQMMVVRTLLSHEKFSNYEMVDILSSLNEV